MQTCKFGVKIFAERCDGVSQAEFIPIFHQWIRRPPFAEAWIDVADYKHVPGGPGVMLVARGGHYSMDERGGRLGVAYRRLRPVEEGAEEALRAAVQCALQAARALQGEESMRGRLGFTPQGMECVVLDGRIRAEDPEAASDFTCMLREALGVEAGGVEMLSEDSRVSARIRWSGPCPVLEALAARLEAGMPAAQGHAGTDADGTPPRQP